MERLMRAKNSQQRKREVKDMPLETKKQQMTLRTQGMHTQTQILLEGDMIVPDSKPDVTQVLRCYGKAKLDDIKIGEEKVQLTGEMVVQVLYRAAEGEKPLYAMTATLPIQEEIYAEGQRAEDTVQVHIETEHMECNLINDRKLGLHAVLCVKLESSGMQSYQMVHGMEHGQAELRLQTIQTLCPLAQTKDRFTLKESFAVAPEQPIIGELLDTNTQIVHTDIRPMEGKAGIRGKLRLQLLYADAQNGTPCALQHDIDFHGFLEANGMTPQSQFYITLEPQEVQIKPEVDEDGEARVFDVSASIGAAMTAAQPTEVEIVSDAYGLEQSLQPMKEEIDYPIAVGTVQNEFALRETVTLSQDAPPMLQAVAVWGNVHITDAHTEKDAVAVEGVLDLEVLYLSEQDDAPLDVWRQSFLFQRSIELRGAKEKQQIQIQQRLEDLDFRLLTEREGEVRAQIILEVQVTDTGHAVLVTELEECEEESNGKAPGAVIYVVQPDEGLWEIAKKYRTTAERILMVNEIENPERLYAGQKLLIFRKC